MKIALLKDPEIRARIEVPLPDINAKPPAMPDASSASSGIDVPSPDPMPMNVDPNVSPT